MPLTDKVKNQLTTLKYIPEVDLSESGVRAEDMKELVQLILSNQVKIGQLHLYRTNIRSKGAEYLAQLTEDNIGYLSVRYSDITDSGAIKLINSTIKRIDMGDNNLSDKSADEFLAKGTQTLLILNKNPNITPEKLVLVDEKLKQNKQNAQKPVSQSPLASYTLFKEPPIQSSSHQTEPPPPPTITANVKGQSITLSKIEAQQLVLDVINHLLPQSNPISDKEFLQDLKTAVDYGNTNGNVISNGPQ